MNYVVKPDSASASMSVDL